MRCSYHPTSRAAMRLRARDHAEHRAAAARRAGGAGVLRSQDAQAAAREVDDEDVRGPERALAVALVQGLDERLRDAAVEHCARARVGDLLHAGWGELDCGRQRE